MSVLSRKLSQVCAGVAAAASLGVAAVPAQSATIQLGFILDRSGSIGGSNWNIIVDGLASAISLIPVGGPNTYEVSVVSFASSASINVSRVLLDSVADRNALATTITQLGDGRANDVYTGGETDYAAAFTAMQNVLAPTIGSAAFSYVNFATDGEPTDGGFSVPTTCNGSVWFLGAGLCNILGGGNFVPGFSVSDNQAGINARNALLASGVDNLSIEGISITASAADNLRNNYCAPGPCDSTSPYNFPTQGFYIGVNGAQGYADAIGNKILTVTGQVPEPQVLALLGIGLLGLVPMLRRRRQG